MAFCSGESFQQHTLSSNTAEQIIWGIAVPVREARFISSATGWIRKEVKLRVSKLVRVPYNSLKIIPGVIRRRTSTNTASFILKCHPFCQFSPSIWGLIKHATPRHNRLTISAQRLGRQQPTRSHICHSVPLSCQWLFQFRYVVLKRLLAPKWLGSI